MLTIYDSTVYRDGKRYKSVSNPVLAVSEAFNRGSPSTAQQLHRDDMAQHFDHLEGSGESSLLGLLLAGVVGLPARKIFARMMLTP